MASSKRQKPPEDYDPVAPLTDDEIARLRPAAEVFAELGIPMPKRPGRPKSERRKVPVTMRLDPDVLDYFRRQGPGWQSRINEILARAAGKSG
jgi:uncharacterized protein (DUF4415 family)